MQFNDWWTRRELTIRYVNGKEVLPTHLLEQVQQYISGAIIYIPTRDERRKGWGEANGTRKNIQRRNEEIKRRYQAGETIRELAQSYYLSEDSIRKIIYYR